MRLVSFSKGGGSAVGLRQGDSVIDLSIAAPKLPRTLAGILAAGASARTELKKVAAKPGTTNPAQNSDQLEGRPPV